jgi:integrase
MPGTVRDFVRKMQNDGASPYVVDKARTILSAIFATALNDQVIFLHPCKGVKVPPTPRKPLVIVTPEQFDAIHRALPDAISRLLVETAIESGLRWGELAELRAGDLDLATGILTVSRTVVELDPKFHPDGRRFLVKPYPKTTKYRRLKLSRQVVARISAHVGERHLGTGDLLFTVPAEPQPRLLVLADPETLGRTKPNGAGRRYRHGTLTGYSLGKCHCEHCQAAYAHYRSTRRLEGKDDPRRGRPLDTDGHIPRGWFRERVWKPALSPPGSIGESGFTTSGTLMRRGCYPAALTSRWSRNASATAASARPRGTSTPSRTLTRPHSMPSPRCVIDEALDKHTSDCVTPETPSGPGSGTASVAGVVVRYPGRLQLDHAPGGVVHLRYRQSEPVPQVPEPFAAGPGDRLLQLPSVDQVGRAGGGARRGCHT